MATNYEQRAMNHKLPTTNYELPTIIMQNKPNFRKAKMKLNFYPTKDYENETTFSPRENKPNQTQFQKGYPKSLPREVASAYLTGASCLPTTNYQLRTFLSPDLFIALIINMHTKVIDKANRKSTAIRSSLLSIALAKMCSKITNEAIKTNIGIRKAATTLKVTEDPSALPNCR